MIASRTRSASRKRAPSTTGRSASSNKISKSSTKLSKYKGKVSYLHTGATIPALGFGTWQDRDAQEEATLAALKIGYRHIDTAAAYGTEPMVGKAIARSKIPRQELFIVTKLWNRMHRPDDVEEACDASLQKLGLDYLDCYEMHFPQSWEREEDPKGVIHGGGIDFVATWKAMEKLVDKGKVRHLGVSNFSKAELTRLHKVARIKPAIHQSEWHPWLVQKDFQKFHDDHNIHITGYSPFGNANPFYKAENIGMLMNEPLLAQVGKKYGKTGAQVALAWQLAHGHSTIPKSKDPKRIKANFEGDFELSAADVKKIDAMDRKLRFNDVSIGNKYNFYADLEGKTEHWTKKNEF